MSKADEVDKLLGGLAEVFNWDAVAKGSSDEAESRGILTAIADIFGPSASDAATTYASALAGAIREQRNFRGEHSMVRTYHIELNVEFKDLDKYKTIEHAVREAAQQVAAFAAILADKAPPRIGVRYDDRFEGTVDIDISGHQSS